MRSHLALSLVLLTGCAAESSEPAALDLRIAIGFPDVDVVGVTVSPTSGQRYLLDRFLGIYELSPAGTATLLRTTTQLPPPDVIPESAFTDIAALGDQRFALTARNDGFLLDLGAETLRQHFCYVPGDLPFDDIYQLTQSVAYDPASGWLYAQPQTIANADGSILDTSVGRFDATTGADLQWYQLSDLTYHAGAIAVRDSDTLILASGAVLSHFSLTSGVVTKTSNLSSHGISEVSGMAVDPGAGTLLVIDSASDELAELPLEILD